MSGRSEATWSNSALGRKTHVLLKAMRDSVSRDRCLMGSLLLAA